MPRQLRLPRSRRAIGLIELLVGIAIATVIVGCFVLVFGRSSTFMANEVAYAGAHDGTQAFIDKLKNDAHSSMAIYVPTTCGATDSTCTELRFYAVDGTQTQRSWGYLYNAATQTVQNCTYASWNASCTSTGNALTGVTTFAARITKVSELNLPMLGGYAPSDYTIPMINPSQDTNGHVMGGNRVAIVDLATAFEAEPVHLVAGGKPFTTVAFQVVSAPPSPTPPPATATPTADPTATPTAAPTATPTPSSVTASLSNGHNSYDDCSTTHQVGGHCATTYTGTLGLYPTWMAVCTPLPGPSSCSYVWTGLQITVSTAPTSPATELNVSYVVNAMSTLPNVAPYPSCVGTFYLSGLETPSGAIVATTGTMTSSSYYSAGASAGTYTAVISLLDSPCSDSSANTWGDAGILGGTFTISN